MNCEIVEIFGDGLAAKLLDEPPSNASFLRKGQTIKLYFPNRLLNQIELSEKCKLTVIRSNGTLKLSLSTKRIETDCTFAVCTDDTPAISNDGEIINYDDEKDIKL